MPLVLSASASQALVKTFACVPEWAALAETIGGDRLDVRLATSARDNPETLAPTADMISALRDSDLVVCTGAHLEDSWLPAAIERADNPKIADGQPGRFLASEFVQLASDAAELRSHSHGAGDQHGLLHSKGNPHIHGDPRNVQLVAAQLAKRLIAIDPDGKDFYTERIKAFLAALKAKSAELEKKAGPLRGIRIATVHENALYLLNWLGIETALTVEPTAGVAADSARLADATEAVRQGKISFVVIAAHEDAAQAASIAETAGVPLIRLPYTIGGTETATDFFALYDESVQLLLAGLH